MENWFDLIDFESVEFAEKVAMDEACEAGLKKEKHFAHSGAHENSWIRKRKFKKAMVRRFLSMNPAMDYSKLDYGMTCKPAIYLHSMRNEDGSFCDPRIEYVFNPYTRVYLSPRGDIRKYHGVLEASRSGSFALGHKDKMVARLTNSRIRHAPLVAMRFSHCKKMYGPRLILW